jgi:hypothetical protein
MGRVTIDVHRLQTVTDGARSESTGDMSPTPEGSTIQLSRGMSKGSNSFRQSGRRVDG